MPTIKRQPTQLYKAYIGKDNGFISQALTSQLKFSAQAVAHAQQGMFNMRERINRLLKLNQSIERHKASISTQDYVILKQKIHKSFKTAAFRYDGFDNVLDRLTKALNVARKSYKQHGTRYRRTTLIVDDTANLKLLAEKKVSTIKARIRDLFALQQQLLSGDNQHIHETTRIRLLERVNNALARREYVYAKFDVVLQDIKENYGRTISNKRMRS